MPKSSSFSRFAGAPNCLLWIAVLDLNIGLPVMSSQHSSVLNRAGSSRKRLRAQVMAGNGIDLIRTWGFLNGVDDPIYAAVSMQPSVTLQSPSIPASLVQQCRSMLNLEYPGGLSHSPWVAFACSSWPLPPCTIVINCTKIPAIAAGGSLQ